MPESIKEIARNEWAKLAEELRKAVPETLPVTILLYQPISDEELDSASGYLVDVGPRPQGATEARVIQGASSGATGDFLNSTHYSVRYLPTPTQIGSAEAESYAAHGTDEAKRLQVHLERLRYPSLPWGQDNLPPVGAYIHHLSISPPVLSLHNIRTPSLGVVYTITNGPEINENVQKLIHVSQVVAKLALRLRVAYLLGTRIECLKRLFANHSSRTANNCDELYQLTTAFILAHHWFYPHAPAGAQALRKISGSDSALEEICKIHGWEQPPRFPDFDPTSSYRLQDDIEALTDDFLQIGQYTLGEASTPRSRAQVLSCLATSLMGLSNRIAYLDLDGLGWEEMGWARDSSSAPVSERLLCVLPDIEEFPEIEVRLPAFSEEELRRSIYTSTKSRGAQEVRSRCFQCAGPGSCKPFQGQDVRVYIKPKRLVTHLKRTDKGLRLETLEDSDAPSDNRWLKAHARFMIESHLKKERAEKDKIGQG